MKFQIKIEIPNSVIKIMVIVGLSLLSTLLIIMGIEFVGWLDVVTCEELTKSYHSGLGALNHYFVDVKIMELECWK